MVAAGTPVVERLEWHRREVRVGVSVEAAGDLRTATQHRLSANGRTFEAKLTAPRPDIATGTRTVTALVEVWEAQGVVFGEVIELTLDLPVKQRGFWVPVSALSEGRKGLWSVFTVVEGETGKSVARKAVEVLYAQAQRAFVRGTLSDEALVVVNGTNRVIPGQEVALATE